MSVAVGSTILQIPFRPGRLQRFRITMAGLSYVMVAWWNDVSQTWILDIYQDDGVTPILRGTPLVTGTDLLGQFEYLDIGRLGAMSVFTFGVGHAPDEIPTFSDLGNEGQVFYISRT